MGGLHRDLVKDSVNGYLIDVADILELTNKLDILIEGSIMREILGFEVKKIGVELIPEKISKRYLEFCTKSYKREV